MAEMIWKSGPDGRQQRDTRAEEIQAGRIYHLLAKTDGGTKMLKDAFPNLDIATVVNSPYTHVTIRVQPKVRLAPLDSPAVLENEEVEDDVIIFEDPLEGYPSNHLVAKLALIA
jgi:hypothetical protein